MTIAFFDMPFVTTTDSWEIGFRRNRSQCTSLPERGESNAASGISTHRLDAFEDEVSIGINRRSLFVLPPQRDCPAVPKPAPGEVFESDASQKSKARRFGAMMQFP
jgi:hypothetical protein